jgi:hypothetical protein
MKLAKERPFLLPRSVGPQFGGSADPPSTTKLGVKSGSRFSRIYFFPSPRRAQNGGNRGDLKFFATIHPRLSALH